MSESIERENFALFGQFFLHDVNSDVLLAVFDTEEAADEAARGIVADPVMLLKHAFPSVCEFWFKPRELNSPPTDLDWETWAAGLMSLHIVRMVGRGSMRVVHSVVQEYFLTGGCVMSEKEKRPEPRPKPVCPYCQTEMKPVKYVGYYDEFYHWECDCSELPGAKEQRGQYA